MLKFFFSVSFDFSLPTYHGMTSLWNLIFFREGKKFRDVEQRRLDVMSQFMASPPRLQVRCWRVSVFQIFMVGFEEGWSRQGSNFWRLHWFFLSVSPRFEPRHINSSQCCQLVLLAHGCMQAVVYFPFQMNMLWVSLTFNTTVVLESVATI